MRPPDVPSDTDPATYAVLVASWRAMGPAQRAALADRTCVDVEQCARANIVARHPSFTEVEIGHELSRRRYGVRLADAASASLLASR